MSIANTSMLPERTTKLAFAFVHTLFDWWVMRVDKELFLLLYLKDMTLTDVIIDRSASDCPVCVCVCVLSLTLSRALVNFLFEFVDRCPIEIERILLRDKVFDDNQQRWQRHGKLLMLAIRLLACNSKRLSDCIHSCTEHCTGNI
jgi:hypothetical protein